MQGDGTFVERPNWSPAAAPAVARVPGSIALASGRRVGRAEFQALAARMKQWGEAQSVPCGFRVRVRERHGNLALFQQQHRLVGRYFYPAW